MGTRLKSDPHDPPARIPPPEDIASTAPDNLHGANPPGRKPDRVLLLFIDGLGLPSDVPLRETVYRAAPTFVDLIEAHGVAIDATLGVPGTPQSATGQATLLTGVNAARVNGAHLQGFPNAVLRGLIEAENVFAKLLIRGVPCTFANAYVHAPGRELPTALRSATTVATLAAFDGRTRNRTELMRGEAVYHDITRHSLVQRGILDVPRIDEAEAAQHLMAVCRSVRFCLFEYFLTDIAGHRGTGDDREGVLASVDRFLACLIQSLDPVHDLLLLVSDHGNIEDGSRRGHTMNPVPWIAVGAGAEVARSHCRSLVDVTPVIVSLLGAG